MNMRKTLTKTMDLAGQEETITAMELRQAVGDILLQVQLGKKFTITRNGVIVAVLSRPRPTALELGSEIRRLGLVGS